MTAQIFFISMILGAIICEGCLIRRKLRLNDKTIIILNDVLMAQSKVFILLKLDCLNIQSRLDSIESKIIAIQKNKEH